MKQKKSKGFSQHALFLGKCIDELYSLQALVEFQQDSLLGLSQHHPDHSHHMVLSQEILARISKLSDSIDNKLNNPSL